MLTVHFRSVTLTKTAKYLLLLTAHSQTKRTNVSQWTSTPQFQSLQIDEATQNIELKLCQATSDRRLKIVGNGYSQKELVFEGQVRLQQEVQGEKICVGLVYLTISKTVTFKQLQFSPQLNNSNITNKSAIEQRGEDDEQQEQYEPNEEVRLQFHCGFGFYLASAFRFEVEWGKQIYSSQSIKDKINPVWSQTGCLSGPSQKPLQLRVCDDKNNVLESMRIGIAELRVMFTYHLRIKFKQQVMGATPQVFVSIVRQSFPLFSIAEIPVRFNLRSLGQIAKSLSYLLVSLNNQLRLPQFIYLERGKMGSLQLVNRYIESRSAGEQDRIQMVGVPVGQQKKSFSVLKSYMNRKLYLHLVTVSDIGAVFKNSNSSGLKMIESKCDAEVVLRRIYYNNQTYSIKKHLQISNPQHEMLQPSHNASAQQRWKVLSNNYTLRHHLVVSTQQHIHTLTKSIHNQGQQLVQLKKVAAAVRNINNSLITKQRLMASVKGRKINYNPKQITNQQLIAALISTQSQLQQKKNINSQLAVRMDCLGDVEQNQQDLSVQLVRNSQILLQQQTKLQKMRLMQRQIAKQRQVIGELQKLFQTREIDRRVNQALKQQSQKLAQLRNKKQKDLLQVYQKVRSQKTQGSSMAARVRRAQQTLIQLNQQYVRMLSL